jgi:hypothetical protein
LKIVKELMTKRIKMSYFGSYLTSTPLSDFTNKNVQTLLFPYLEHSSLSSLAQTSHELNDLHKERLYTLSYCNNIHPYKSKEWASEWNRMAGVSGVSELLKWVAHRYMEMDEWNEGEDDPHLLKSLTDSILNGHYDFPSETIHDIIHIYGIKYVGKNSYGNRICNRCRAVWNGSHCKWCDLLKWTFIDELHACFLPVCLESIGGFVVAPTEDSFQHANNIMKRVYEDYFEKEYYHRLLYNMTSENERHIYFITSNTLGPAIEFAQWELVEKLKLVIFSSQPVSSIRGLMRCDYHIGKKFLI